MIPAKPLTDDEVRELEYNIPQDSSDVQGFFALVDYKAVEETLRGLNNKERGEFLRRFANLFSDVMLTDNYNLMTKQQQEFIAAYISRVDNSTLSGIYKEFDEFMGGIIDG